MPFASGSLLQIRYAPETIPGTIPASGTTNLRTTGANLKYDLKYETSKEIRSDRATTDMTPVSASSAGSVNYEFSFQEYDPFIAAALQSTWGTALNQTITATIAVSTDATLTASSGTPFTGVVPGQFVKVAGFASSKNNGFFRVKSATSTALTFDAAEGLIAATSTSNVTVKGSRIKNGATMQYFSIEEMYSDVSQYRVFKGMTPSKMSLDFSTGNIVGGSIEFMGYSAAVGGAAFLPGTATASKTGAVFNAVQGVDTVYQGGAPLAGTAFRNLKLDIDNGLRGQEAIGTLGYVGIGSGTLQVTGSVEAYFANAALYNLFLSNTETSLAWAVTDNNGDGYAITLPRVKFSSGDLNGQQLNSDVVVQLNFTALLDAASGAVIQIDRAV